MKLPLIGCLLTVATLAAGCASSATYSPPEGRRATDTCPLGEIWVCRDHYPSRLETANEPPLSCMCQDVSRIR